MDHDDEEEQFREEDEELDQRPKSSKKKKKKKKKKKPSDEMMDDLEASGVLAHMEEDAMAKASKGRSGAPAVTPGAVAGGEDSDRQAAIQSIEEDIAAKSRGRASVSREQIVGNGSTTDSSIIQHVEAEMMEKKRASSSMTSSNGDASLRKSDGAPAMSAARDMESEDFKGVSNGHKDGDEEAPLVGGPPSGAGAAASPLGDPSGQEAYPGLNEDDDGGEALQAFVAEEEVVEATGVAVLMSEEEEEELEKRRKKRYIIGGILIFVVIVVAAVVPAVIVTTNKGDVIQNEPSSAPTEVPSASPSMMPSTVSLGATVDYLITNSISSLEAFSTRDSPQFKAAQWMADEDPLALDFDNEAQEPRWLQRYRLVTFYFATGGDDWRECGRDAERCSGGESKIWLETEDECEWFSLLCRNGVVHVINFNNPFGNFLVGELPEELFGLTGLEGILIQNNELAGTMSESWGRLTSLQQVFLNGNKFSGVVPEVFWQNIPTLTRVVFSNNNLEGPISRFISGLPSLQILRFDNNRMSGPIPDELFDTTSLVDLRFAQNNFTGPLSERVGSLAALTDLQLQDNMFDGPLPTALSTLKNLKFLNLEKNEFTGSITFAVCALPGLTPSVDCEEVDCPKDCCECF